MAFGAKYRGIRQTIPLVHGPAMAVSILRGIRVIDWKNADKCRFIRYSVRVKRGEFNPGDLERAKLLLLNTKTPHGPLAIPQGVTCQSHKAMP